jgi:hypothetical protein
MIKRNLTKELLCCCKNCSHSGVVSIEAYLAPKTLSRLICSECGSREVKVIYVDELMSEPYDDRSDYFVEDQNPEIEEREMNIFMMAPTGWEDDKELQAQIGLTYGTIPENG